MTDRYDLLIASMREASRVVCVIAGLAVSILAARWSIKFLPPPIFAFMQAAFDLWFVLCILVLFIISK